MRLRNQLLVLALLTSPVLAEPVDNCATLLGSLSVELRIARTLPSDRRTTFVCPKDTSSLHGASKQRILNSLGPPDALGPDDARARDGALGPDDGRAHDDALGPDDATGGAGGASVGTKWSYFFSGARAGERGAGIPQLTFNFDSQQQVDSIDCQLTH